MPAGAPSWLETTTVATPNGTTSNALVVADIAHVAWAVNLGCLGLHLWPYLAAEPGFADELRIDLDPQPGVGFDEVRTVAFHCRDLLTELGLVGYPKTTGNRGLHIYLRLEAQWDATAVRSAAVALARELERRHPDAHHRQLVEGGARRAGLRRLQSERPAQDRLRRVVRPTSNRRPGFDAPVVGRGRRRGSRRPDHPDRAQSCCSGGAIPGRRSARLRSRSSRCSSLVERDKAAGLHDAPWPPEYPKGADEPTRVAPSRAKKA